jgi:hypothetical protein
LGWGEEIDPRTGLEKLIGKPMRVERLARLRAVPAEFVMNEAVRVVEVLGLMEGGLA